MRVCRYCKKSVANDIIICPFCGKAIPWDMESHQKEISSTQTAPSSETNQENKDGDIIYLCPNCGGVYHNVGNNTICPKCNSIIVRTGISCNSWLTYSDAKKQEVFRLMFQPMNSQLQEARPSVKQELYTGTAEKQPADTGNQLNSNVAANKDKTKRKIVWVLSAVLLLVGLAAGGFFLSDALKDKTPPVITLKMEEDTIFVGEKLPDYTSCATAADDRDGDITSSIKLSTIGIDSSKAGTYKAVFTVSDKAGNESSSILTVNIVSHNRWDPVVRDGYYAIPFDRDEFISVWNQVNPDALFGYDSLNNYSIDGRDINSKNAIVGSYITLTMSKKNDTEYGLSIALSPFLYSNYGYPKTNILVGWRVDANKIKYWASCGWQNSKIEGSSEDKMVTYAVETFCLDLFSVLFPYDDKYKIWNSFVEWLASDAYSENNYSSRVGAEMIKSVGEDDKCFRYGAYEFSVTNGQNLIFIFCRAAG